MTREEIINEKRNFYIALGLISVVMIIMVLSGRSLGYKDGLYAGAKAVCNDLDVGINQDGDYVCYDVKKYDKPFYKSEDFDINIDIGEINGS